MSKVPISVILSVSTLVEKAVAKRLETVQRAIQDFYQGVEVIVVEQDLGMGFKFLPHLPDTVKKIKLSYPVYNKGWNLNVGVRHSSNDYVVVCDADMYSNGFLWEELYDWMKNNRQWGFAWNRIIYTNDEQRQEMLKRRTALPGVKYDTPRRAYSEGGLVCYHKPFFYDIGQYNETLVELGGIDNEIIVRAYARTKTYDMFNHTVYHLWHPQIYKGKRPTRHQNKQRLTRVKKRVFSAIKWLRNEEQGITKYPLNHRIESGNYHVNCGLKCEGLSERQRRICELGNCFWVY